MSEVLIKVEGVSKKFCKDLKRSLWYGMQDIASAFTGNDKAANELRKGEFWALQDVSFEVKRGECLGLIGHNGAGKSTLLKMLNGLIRPDKGRIEMRGRIGALIELGAGFNPVLTGRENVYNNGAVLGFTKAEIDRKFDDIVAFAELEEFIDMPVQNYSSGMKVRLGFAVATQMEPDILIIDEVLAVGDIGFQIKCFNSVQELTKKAAVILVSHSMPNIGRISTSIMLLKSGTCHYHGDNLNLGFTKYYEDFNGEKHFVSGTTTYIHNLQVFDSVTEQELDANESINPFSSLKFKYEIDLKEFEIGEYRAVYVFYDQTLRQLAQHLTQSFYLEKNNGKQKLELQLKNLNFCSTKLNFSIAFYKIEDSKLRIYTYHRNLLTLNFAPDENLTHANVTLHGTHALLS